MPRLPFLTPGTTYQEMTENFAGYNHNPKILDGEFYETKNLSTADYPLLAPRKKRGYVKDLYDPGGVLDKVELAYVDEGTLYLNDRPTSLTGLTSGEKQLVSYGAYICVFPDKMYYNTADPADYGKMWDEFDSTNVSSNSSATDARQGKKFWFAADPPEKSYSGHYMEHPEQTEDTYYAFLTFNAAPGHTASELVEEFDKFNVGDRILLPTEETCFEESFGAETDMNMEWVKRNPLTIVEKHSWLLSTDDTADVVEYEHCDPATGTGTATGKYFVLCNYHTLQYDGKPNVREYYIPYQAQYVISVKVNGVETDDYFYESYYRRFTFDTAPGAGNNNVQICYEPPYATLGRFAYLVAIPKSTALQPYSSTTLKQDNIPEMDYVIECKNRLWGCKYGVVGNQNINEIYACELGNFKHWRNYDGTAMAPWAASVGSDGPWTGAINYMGYPTFFKEDRIHRVSVSAIGAHEITETVCDGVQNGSARSLVVINGVLFYKSQKDICIWQGGVAPTRISEALGDIHYNNAVAGTVGEKYYISMKDDDGQCSLFCFDTKRSLWMKEDDLCVKQFAAVGEELYALTDTKQLWALMGTAGTPEEEIFWHGESGIMYYRYNTKKYVSRFNFRLQMEKGARMKCFIMYDSSGRWEPCGEIISDSLRTITLPVRPRRCDHLRIRLEGRGVTKIFSFARILELGSDY